MQEVANSRPGSKGSKVWVAKMCAGDCDGGGGIDADVTILEGRSDLEAGTAGLGREGKHEPRGKAVL